MKCLNCGGEIENPEETDDVCVCCYEEATDLYAKFDAIYGN